MIGTIFSGYDDLIVIVVALVVLFGGTQLPKLARNAGEAMHEFRKAHTEASSAVSAAAAEPPAPELPAAGGTGGAAVPSAAPGPVAAALATGAGQVPPDERLTMSRSELEALLAAREAQVKADAAQA